MGPWDLLSLLAGWLLVVLLAAVLVIVTVIAVMAVVALVSAAVRRRPGKTSTILKTPAE